jgi:hypothetical protein
MDSRLGFENPQENADFEQNAGLLDSCSWNPDLSLAFLVRFTINGPPILWVFNLI